MKRKGYRWAIEWIANNDEAGSNEPAETVAGYPSVCLVADMFDKHQLTVAQAVVKKKQEIKDNRP